MIEDQMNDLRSQVSSLSGNLERTHAQVKEMQLATLPAPVAPPPAPRTDGKQSLNPSVPPNQEPAKAESQAATSPVANRATPGPTKPDLHGLVMRELKDLLERRKKFADSQN